MTIFGPLFGGSKNGFKAKTGRVRKKGLKKRSKNGQNGVPKSKNGVEVKNEKLEVVVKNEKLRSEPKVSF
jgi:hypothetical protein